MLLKLAFLQVRMGSTRLPGKAMLRIGGKSLLERTVERLIAARALDGVVVLTTHLEEDDIIAEEADRMRIPVFRGPVHDVLGRFRQAWDRFRADIIVRATADNPLIDIGSVDRTLRTVESQELDYCMESDLPVGAATEALTGKALERVDQLASDSRHREHVTLFIKEHPDKFRVDLPLAPPPLRRPDLRLTVDTYDDFLFLDLLLGELAEKEHPIPLSKYLTLPHLFSSARA